MRVAIPLWQGRVSPVFDEASRIVLVDLDGTRELQRHEESLPTRNPLERAQLLPTLGVELLVCGMVSLAQRTAIEASGIRIIPHICGAIDEVVAAVANGRVETGAFLMPGCGGRRGLRRRRGRNARCNRGARRERRSARLESEMEKTDDHL